MVLHNPEIQRCGKQFESGSRIFFTVPHFSVVPRPQFEGALRTAHTSVGTKMCSLLFVRKELA